MALNCIYKVTEAGVVIARFVYGDDAHAFATAATEREHGRTLVVENKGQNYNAAYCVPMSQNDNEVRMWVYTPHPRA